MASSDFSDLAEQHTLEDNAVPQIVTELAGDDECDLVWHNDLGGLTFRIGERFVKWNPLATGVDLSLERERLGWLLGRHLAPRVVDFGSDDEAQWLVTEALDGEHAVGDKWRARRSEAIGAIATGLRVLHSVPIHDFPLAWAGEGWVNKTPGAIGPRPEVNETVLVHGDACAPNTLISESGKWTGNVDFGDLSIGDPWADLAIASLSLDWNFGEGHQDEFFAAYGVEKDEIRIDYYRALWELES